MNWRPKSWRENPCQNCTSKSEDDYGYFCDLSCGKHTAYKIFEAGADVMLKALREEIEKVKNPYSDYLQPENAVGFAVCQKKILKIMSSKDGL